ncbi:MAG: histidine kinase [Spirochaetia bacterium]|nr:histidine kinase [Spirochaetia bacterium]
MRKTKANLFYIPLLLILSNSIFAISPVQLSDDIKKYELGLDLEYFEDKSGNLTIDDISSAKYINQFQKSGEKTPSFGYTGSAIWFHFKIDAKETQIKKWLLEMAAPPTYNFILFQRTKDNLWQKTEVGSLKPFSERPIDDRNFVFSVELKNSHEFYARIKTGGSLFLPLTLWEPIKFAEKVQKEQLFLGIFFGILFIMAIYNLFLYFATREKNYLFYILYAVNLGLAMFADKGMTLQYFWPNAPYFNNTIELFFYNSSLIWALIFSRSFLQTKITSPVSDIIIKILLFITALVMPLFFIGFKDAGITVNVNMSLFSPVIVLFISIYVYVRGYKAARLFLIAFTGLMLGIPPYILKLKGLLNSNLFTENSLFLGSVAEMVLLSFALADQINILRVNKQDAERKALESELLYSREKLESQKVRYEKLKKVIQPHYLLNSLNTMLSWISKNPEKSEDVIADLTDEFRLTYKLAEKKEVKLKEELRLCRAHLRIMGIRFDKNFELKTNNITEDEKIPPLIFHTLLENAFLYQNLNEKNTVIISKEETENSVEYLFETKGDMLETDSNNSSKTGIGGKYIKTVLETAYPGKWQFESSQSKGGWKSVIKIVGTNRVSA